MVHLPLQVSNDLKGKSANGIYGDAVEEIDWSTGENIKTLKKLAAIITADIGDAGKKGKNQRPSGMVKKPHPQLLIQSHP